MCFRIYSLVPPSPVLQKQLGKVTQPPHGHGKVASSLNKSSTQQLNTCMPKLCRIEFPLRFSCLLWSAGRRGAAAR
ncbi:hypothetical protein E2C01_093468 [Portunus trituberculatus]|uniref:Uncharacterized protein n=1 Tax=Portunus trituberculatus TaxID=210409 RepID=A0A5B7JUV8_PORTR|nr:hypothetical protein [Portunus trituberculatus]